MTSNPALAHISEDKARAQTVYEHLSGTADLAGEFAAPFGATEEARFAGWLHDIGKYSTAFQKRLLEDGPRVDHATAGAREAMHCRPPHPQAAFAVAGHHTGLPDGGNQRNADPEDGTLFGRLKKPVEPYGGWQEVPLPQSAPPAWANRDLLDFAFLQVIHEGTVIHLHLSPAKQHREQKGVEQHQDQKDDNVIVQQRFFDLWIFYFIHLPTLLTF